MYSYACVCIFIVQGDRYFFFHLFLRWLPPPFLNCKYQSFNSNQVCRSSQILYLLRFKNYYPKSFYIRKKWEIGGGDGDGEIFKILYTIEIKIHILRHSFTYTYTNITYDC